MRTITTAQDEVLTRGNYKVAFKVEIEDGDAVLQDVSAFFGRDWIKSVTWGEDVDTPVKLLTLNLIARSDDLSMHPLDEDSQINLNGAGAFDSFLDLTRQIRVSTATVAIGYTPVSADFEVVFDGNIDIIDEKSAKEENLIIVQARDEGGFLQDTWVEDLERYGDGTAEDTDNIVNPYPLEDLLQDILDTWAPGVTLFSENGTAGTPFNPSDSPGFDVTAWDVQIQGVLSALRVGANSIGWECRYRFVDDVTVDDFELVLYEPDRTKVAIDRTFAPVDYINVNKLGLNIDRIRNVVEVSFQTDPDDPQTLTTVTQSDAASITRYGRRWMAIVEDATSAINTATEANLMASAILSDLREPDREQEIEMHYFWAVQTQDLYRFTANDKHYTTDQDWAIIAYRHTLSRDRHRTVLTTRRAPSGGVAHWWGQIQIGGLAPVTRDKPPFAPAPVLDVLDHGVLVTWDKPIRQTDQYFEVHRSLTAAFTPDSSTLVQRVHGNRYRDNGLDQETPYFYKVQAVDRWGNVSAAGAEATTQPGFLRGFPGPIVTSVPDPTATQPGQMFLYHPPGATFGKAIRRHYRTYDDIVLADTPLFYLLMDLSGSTEPDESSNGNDFDDQGTGTPPGGGTPAINDGGTSRNFIGNQLGITSLLGDVSVSALTLECWINYTGDANQNTLLDIIDFGGSDEFRVRFATGTLKTGLLEVLINGTTYGNVGAVKSTFQQAGWMLLHVTWAAGGDIKIYANGKLLATISVAAGGGASAITVDDITIGTNNAGLGDPFEGRIDNMAVYTSVLDQNAINDRLRFGGMVDTRFEVITDRETFSTVHMTLSVDQAVLTTALVKVKLDSFGRGQSGAGGTDAGPRSRSTMGDLFADIFNNRVVIRKAGLYFAKAQINPDNVSSPTNATVDSRLRLNGNFDIACVNIPGTTGTSNPAIQMSWMGWLDVNDFLEIFVQSADSNYLLLTDTTSVILTHLQVTKLQDFDIG